MERGRAIGGELSGRSTLIGRNEVHRGDCFEQEKSH